MKPLALCFCANSAVKADLVVSCGLSRGVCQCNRLANTFVASHVDEEVLLCLILHVEN